MWSEDIRKSVNVPIDLSAEETALAAKLLGKILGPRNDVTRVQELEKIACQIYDSRRQRRHFFSEGLFGEPVWDMLLALYCESRQGVTLSVTAACMAADVPATTGLRWLKHMEQIGLVARETHPTDGRSSFVTLTERAEERMRAYLSRINERHLALNNGCD